LKKLFGGIVDGIQGHLGECSTTEPHLQLSPKKIFFENMSSILYGNFVVITGKKNHHCLLTLSHAEGLGY
jgi:hypothetical protein